MGMSFFCPHQTAFSKTEHATTGARHGASESILGNGGSGAVGRGGRFRVANACDHCGGPFGMVTYRCWGSKFCKKACKASFLQEFYGRNEICRCLGLVRKAWTFGFWSTLPSRVMASAQP